MYPARLFIVKSDTRIAVWYFDAISFLTTGALPRNLTNYDCFGTPVNVLGTPSRCSKYLIKLPTLSNGFFSAGVSVSDTEMPHSCWHFSSSRTTKFTKPIESNLPSLPKRIDVGSF